MKILVLGDTHGDQGVAGWTNQMCVYARENGAQHIIICGDFGLWTHELNGHVWLDRINAGAVANNLTIFAVGGNHENWDHWYQFMDMGLPTHKGFVAVRSRVLLAPKVNYWKWAGKQFLAVGGAVSVDKAYRLQQENAHAKKNIYSGLPHNSGRHTLWWPGEQLTDDELAQVDNRKVDFLFTHDCSNRTPFRGRLKPDMDSMAHRQKIDEVLDRAHPEMHFHGHMHTRYEWMNWTDGDHFVDTLGLDCAQGNPHDAYGILDTDAETFTWPSGTKASFGEAKRSAFEIEEFPGQNAPPVVW